MQRDAVKDHDAMQISLNDVKPQAEVDIQLSQRMLLNHRSTEPQF